MYMYMYISRKSYICPVRQMVAIIPPVYASVSAIYELQEPSRATSRQLRKLRYQICRSEAVDLCRAVPKLGI